MGIDYTARGLVSILSLGVPMAVGGILGPLGWYELDDMSIAVIRF